MTCRLRGLATALLFGVAALRAGPAPAAQLSGYRLGPDDKLEIRVYDVRAGAADVHQWVALNGEFVVDASGGVSLPLLGEVPASDGTPTDLADAIASRLQSKIGLAQLPNASVEVIRYRSFYIMGAVDKPGAYEYHPGLTVLQAVSTAGGMVRAADGGLLGFERDALSQRGELRVLNADRVSLLVRQARLDAEIADTDVIAFPNDIKARSSDPDVARATREEQLLFDSRRDALKSRIETLKQARMLLQSELTSLAAKDVTLSHQLDLSRKELAQISNLVSKGMAVVPRQLAAEQSAASFESSRLDVQLATLRAQQDLAKTDRDMIDLHAKRRDDALTEATEVRAKLAADRERIGTVDDLIYQAEVRSPLTVARSEAKRQPGYVLTHSRDGTMQNRVVTDGDLVAPGDVLRVMLPQGDAIPVARSETPTASGLPSGEAADASPAIPARR